VRTRQGDAVLLAHAFLRRFAQEQRRGAMSFSEDAVRAIEAHDWPGNVRELLNVVKRSSIMADGQRVTADDMGLPVPAGVEGEPNDASVAATGDLDLRAAREEAERRTIVTALARTNNNILKAAELLGVSRPTLYDLMHRLAIK
jgi:two-component system NtrC family response regulator